MARIRTIKPEFWTDEKLSELPESVHILAAALLNHADDEGYFNANPALVRAACFPLREPSVSVHGGLTQLCELDYIRIAKGVDGRSYGWVVGFAKHQRVNRPTPSRIKSLVSSWEPSRRTHGGLTEDSLPEQGTGNREVEQGKEEDCDEQAELASSPPVETEIVLKFPLVGKGAGVWALTKAKLAEYQEAFPGIDVLQECRAARQWCIDNPKKRKTSTGIQGFLSRWLAKSQNTGRASPVQPTPAKTCQLMTEDEFKAWRPS